MLRRAFFSFVLLMDYSAYLGDPHRSRSDEKKYCRVLADHTKEWPGLCCWWCTNPIPADGHPLPMVITGERPKSLRPAYKFHLRGFFCSVGCVKAFCVSRDVGFAPTRMLLAKTGALSWKAPPVEVAPNYLCQQRFGPGPYKSETRHVRRSVIETGPPCAQISSRGCVACARRRKLPGASCAPAPVQIVARRRKRHRGEGTLVPWLDPPS